MLEYYAKGHTRALLMGPLHGTKVRLVGEGPWWILGSVGLEPSDSSEPPEDNPKWATPLVHEYRKPNGGSKAFAIYQKTIKEGANDSNNT